VALVGRGNAPPGTTVKAVKRRVRSDRGHSHGKPNANAVAPSVDPATLQSSQRSFSPQKVPLSEGALLNDRSYAEITA